MDFPEVNRKMEAQQSRAEIIVVSAARPGLPVYRARTTTPLRITYPTAETWRVTRAVRRTDPSRTDPNATSALHVCTYVGHCSNCARRTTAVALGSLILNKTSRNAPAFRGCHSSHDQQACCYTPSYYTIDFHDHLLQMFSIFVGSTRTVSILPLSLRISTGTFLAPR